MIQLPTTPGGYRAVLAEPPKRKRIRGLNNGGGLGPQSRAWKGGRHTPLTHFNKFKRAAERRGLEWNLTIADIDDLFDLQRGLCAMSGVALQFDHGQRNGHRNGNASLDRIDNRRGYHKDNVQLVTKAVNMGKQGESYADFVQMCMRVVEHHLCE